MSMKLYVDADSEEPENGSWKDRWREEKNEQKTSLIWAKYIKKDVMYNLVGRVVFHSF